MSNEETPTPTMKTIPASVIRIATDRRAQLREYCQRQLENTGPGESPWSKEVEEEIRQLDELLKPIKASTAPTDVVALRAELEEAKTRIKDLTFIKDEHLAMREYFEKQFTHSQEQLTSTKRERDEAQNIAFRRKNRINELEDHFRAYVELVATAEKARDEASTERDRALAELAQAREERDKTHRGWDITIREHDRIAAKAMELNASLAVMAEALNRVVTAWKKTEEIDSMVEEIVNRAHDEGWVNDPTGSGHITDAYRKQDRANQELRESVAALSSLPPTEGAGQTVHIRA